MIVVFATGMVGALVYLQKARISPDAAFSVVDWTAYVLFVVVIGGVRTIEGPMVGVLVFWAATIPEFGRFLNLPARFMQLSRIVIVEP